MIAPTGNGNGPLQGNGPSVMASSTGQGAFSHYLDDSEYLAGLEADRPLVCNCNATPSMCEDCRQESADRLRLLRLRLAEGLDVDDGEPEPGYFVDSRLDGEPRDYPEDVS